MTGRSCDIVVSVRSSVVEFCLVIGCRIPLNGPFDPFIAEVWSSDPSVLGEDDSVHRIFKARQGKWFVGTRWIENEGSVLVSKDECLYPHQSKYLSARARGF